MRAAWLLVACGCGRIGFAPPDRSILGDGRSNDGVTRDGVAPDALVPQCSQFTAFGAPVRVASVDTVADDWGPALASGGTELYFYSLLSAGPGAPDIWRATRATTPDPFGAPAVVTEVSSARDDTHPQPSPDDLELFFSTDRVTVGDKDIWVARRSDRASPFGAPVAVPELSSMFVDLPGPLTPDGLDMIISSDRAGAFQLYLAHRPDRGSPFGAPQPIAELASGFTDEVATLTGDGLTIFFTSNRPGGLGGFDIWTASRPSLAAPFSTPAHVVELSSARDDYGPAISADGTALYYSYDTTVQGGQNAELWIATRTCM